MVNREKGEVSATLAGTTYTLVKKFKACVAVESLLSTPERRFRWVQVENELQTDDPSAECIAAAVLMLLLTHQPETTLDDVYDLFDRAGGAAIGAAIRDAFRASAPDPRDVKVLDSKRPPKAQPKRGTGESSSSPDAVPA